MNLDLTTSTRQQLWQQLQTSVEDFYTRTGQLRVAPELNRSEIQEYIAQPVPGDHSPAEALAHVIEGMSRLTVHTPHPRYFGLFNPRAAFPGVLADTLTAAFNPQLAAWSHAPFAVEVENYLIREIGQRFGYPKDTAEGIFTTGGAEANLTALQLALTHRFPEFAQVGTGGIANHPLIYTSAESHHSVVRAARVSGLGSHSVKTVPVDRRYRMIPDQLEQQIRDDRKQGFDPFLVVATGGTTGAGAIDPIPEIAQLCRQHSLWLHLDAAYGGAVVLDEATKPLLEGSEHADSITFDAHKWLSMPMSTSLLLTRHPDLLRQTFGISTDYMPKDAVGLPVGDPFTSSIQWSRRFSGLKLYLTLQMVGWKGLAELVQQQIARGHQLRALLKDNGWITRNDTELPVVCFTDPAEEYRTDFAPFVCQQVISSGQAWLSTYRLDEVTTLRACITNYATTEADLDQLVQLLNQIRNRYNC